MLHFTFESADCWAVNRQALKIVQAMLAERQALTAKNAALQTWLHCTPATRAVV